jgi:hypothetical protein
MGPKSPPMAPPPDNSHYVRRVVLPSGRAIEVVYFENPDPAPVRPADDRPLHICPVCEAGLVYPVAWEEHDAVHWHVDLRCPNCEWISTDLYAQDVVDRFDEELDRGTETLVRDLKQLTRANMEDEIERFIRALECDALLPEDF